MENLSYTYTHTSFVPSFPSSVNSGRCGTQWRTSRGFLVRLSKDWKLAHSKGSVNTSCCSVVVQSFFSRCSVDSSQINPNVIMVEHRPPVCALCLPDVIVLDKISEAFPLRWNWVKTGATPWQSWQYQIPQTQDDSRAVGDLVFEALCCVSYCLLTVFA